MVSDQEANFSWHYSPVTMYTPGQLVLLLHQLPHVNISLQRLEDTRFRPDSESYLQSLAITGSVTWAGLILTLIILASCYILSAIKVRYQGNQEFSEKKRLESPIQTFLVSHLLLCPGLLRDPGGRLLWQPRAPRGARGVQPVHGQHGEDCRDSTKPGDNEMVKH